MQTSHAPTKQVSDSLIEIFAEIAASWPVLHAEVTVPVSGTFVLQHGLGREYKAVFAGCPTSGSNDVRALSSDNTNPEQRKRSVVLRSSAGFRGPVIVY